MALRSRVWSHVLEEITVKHHTPAKGGHFAAREQPELFAAELRTAFRTLREAQ